MATSADPRRGPTCCTGLGSDDNPIFPNMHQASRHVVGASLEAARQVWTGQVDHAANIAGGLHHAMPDRVSGFCVYNDVAVAIRWLLDNGAERVAYVDVDVHHGDGVEQHLLRRPAGADDLPARDRADAVPRDRLPGRRRRPGRAGLGGQRGAAARHLGRRVAARLPRRGPAAAARVRARRPGHPARAATATATTRWPTLRSASTASGPATSPCTTWRTRSPSAGGWPRRRWLRDRRRGPPGVDPPAGRRLRDPAGHGGGDARSPGGRGSVSASAYAPRRG